MTVRIEGRSRACCSPVRFDVYNPWNNCGITQYAELGQQWDVQVVELDLGSCAVPGQGVQAVRIDPVSGTVALTRMKVTLHGAQW